MLIICPVCYALLEVDAAAARRLRLGAAAAPSSCCSFAFKQVLLPTLANPVVFTVILGVIVNPNVAARASPKPSFALVLGSWGSAMRGAVRNKES